MADAVALKVQILLDIRLISSYGSNKLENIRLSWWTNLQSYINSLMAKRLRGTVGMKVQILLDI